MSGRWRLPWWRGLPGWPRVSITVVLTYTVFAAAGCRTGGGDATALTLEAHRQLSRGAADQALESVRRARLANGGASPKEAAALRLLEAEVLIAGQKESAGLSLLAEPLPPQARELAARQAMLTGWALRRTESWTAAREKLEWALGEAHRGGDRSTEVMAGVQLASGLISLRRYPEAAAELKRASNVASALNDPYFNGIVRFSQASLWMKQGEPDRSTELFRAIADDAQRSGDTALFARALDNMAINYAQVGDYERALDYNQRVLQAFDRLKLPDGQMQSHGSRGLLLLDLERAEEAVPELERALGLARTRGNPTQIRRWSGNLTLALLALGRLDEAENLTAEALRGDPQSPYSLSNRAAIHELRGHRAQAGRDWETVLAGKDCPTGLRWHAHFGLARLHAAANERAPAGRRYREAFRLVDEAWASLRTDDSRLTFLTQAMGVYRSYARALVGWGDEREALRVEESSRARLLGDHGGRAPQASMESLARLARRTHSVFLAYWLTDGGASHVRAIGGGRSERVPLPGVDSREITRLVREHNELVERRLEDPRERGTAALRLYELLVKPVESSLRGATRVVLIPDAALHRLNFETLVRVGKDGRKGFWIEDVTLQVAPSLSLLEEKAVRPAVAHRLLLMGDAMAAPDFDRLDHAAAEMKVVGDIFGAGSVTRLAAGEATPSSYGAASPGSHTHIHFSAHAKADRESPLDSAVILTPEPGPGGQLRYRLLAREVASIPLTADLVTVSACRSAGDRAVSGEGMVGFAWAFLRAGAGNVVAGLWDVNDRSTAKLMGELYAGIHTGKAPAEALRAAKLAFIAGGKNYAKPYYWAPFQNYSRSVTRP